MPRLPYAVLLAICGLAVAGRPAAAQRITSPYRFVDETQSLGAFAGYVSTDRGQVRFGPGSGPLFGARYSLRINGPFTLEGSAGILPTNRAVVRLDSLETDTIPRQIGETDLSLLVLDAALRFNLTGPRTYRNLMPFVLFAGGVAFKLAGDSDAGADLASDARFRFGTSFAGQVGGGIEWFLARRLALRADARTLFWQLDSPPAFVAGIPDISSEEWVQNYLFAVGLSYRF